MCQSCTLSARVTDNPNALVHLVHVQETGTAGGLIFNGEGEKREKKEKKEREKKEKEKERKIIRGYHHL